MSEPISGPIQAKEIGSAARAVWKRRPRLQVKIRKKSTRFIFRLPFSIKRKLRKADPALALKLLKRRRFTMSEALVFSYSYKSVGKKQRRPIKQLINRLLYQVFVGGLGVLLDNVPAKMGRHDRQRTQEVFDAIPAMAKRDSGPKKSKAKTLRHSKQKTAMSARLRRRYDQLRPQVEKLRKFLKTKATVLAADQTQLNEQIKQRFRFRWISRIIDRSAVRTFYKFERGRSIDGELIPPNWSVGEMTLRIMELEEEEANPKARLGARTIYENYILPGRSS